jgi:hypothetical protein
MKFNASIVVIDANIAMSAGLSIHPVSSSSRELLQSVLESNMKAAFCPILFGEWNKHSSKYSLMWLSSMTARKKIIRIKPENLTILEIEKSLISEGQRTAAEKDAHIVDLAIATDKFIASNDGSARRVFCIIAEKSPTIKGLIWIVPSEGREAIIGLIANGGYIPKEWQV